MRRYGFISAGGGEWYSRQLSRLNAGDRIAGYQRHAGYVGYGIVTNPAVISRDFSTAAGPLLAQPLAQPNLMHDSDDPSLADYVVGVDWKKTVPISEAKTFDGAFANQNIVCKLRDPKTLEFLKGEFGAAAD
jgi:hypothetical protein